MVQVLIRAVGIGGGGTGGGGVPPPNNLQKGEGFYSANTVLLITKVCHFKKKLCVPPPPNLCVPPQSVIASYGPAHCSVKK